MQCTVCALVVVRRQGGKGEAGAERVGVPVNAPAAVGKLTCVKELDRLRERAGRGTRRGESTGRCKDAVEGAVVPRARPAAVGGLHALDVVEPALDGAGETRRVVDVESVQ